MKNKISHSMMVFPLIIQTTNKIVNNQLKEIPTKLQLHRVIFIFNV